MTLLTMYVHFVSLENITMGCANLAQGNSNLD